jgi:hypothetical protein
MLLCSSLAPLAIDHSLTGVSRFYGCVNHTQVGARSTYRPVHGVSIVDPQQIVAAATLGHVAVVGVASCVQVIMTSLSDHLVWHPVSDPLEEHLVVTCGDAGMVWHWMTPPIIWAKAVPALPTTISATSTTAMPIIAILVRTSSSLPLEKGTTSALAPLSVLPPRAY